MPKPIYIGIDPGVQTGICVYSSLDKQINRLETHDFWSTIKLFNEHIEEHGFGICVVIEDPNLRTAIHWNQKQHLKGANVNAISRMAQNVGMNKKEADLLIKYCKKENIPYKAVKPTKSKVDAKYFKTLTKFQGSTNQHQRDAAMLVYGR